MTVNNDYKYKQYIIHQLFDTLNGRAGIKLWKYFTRHLMKKGYKFEIFDYQSESENVAYFQIMINYHTEFSKRLSNTLNKKRYVEKYIFTTTLWRYLELEVDILTLEKLLFKFI